MDIEKIKTKIKKKLVEFAREYNELLQKAMIATVIAFGLSCILMQPFSLSIATLISTNNLNDFGITDFYNIIADNRVVRTVDRDITILDITDATREDVAEILAMLPEFGPRAVGLDVMFDKPHGNDSLLLTSIENLPGMVMIVDVEGDQEYDARSFHVSETSFFYERMKGHPYGASNFPSKYAGGVIREFRTYFPQSDGHDSIPSFATAVAEQADPAAVGRLCQRGRRSEYIDFPSRKFNTVYWEELASNADRIRGKIVLIGMLNNASDQHPTPTQHQMAGIEIHARALSTILNASYLDSAGDIQNKGLACCLCVILAMFYFWVNPDIRAFCMRFIQVGLLALIIYWGYAEFIERRYLIDISYMLLMLTFVLFGCDIQIGLKGIIRRIKNRKRNASQ